MLEHVTGTDRAHAPGSSERKEATQWHQKRSSQPRRKYSNLSKKVFRRSRLTASSHSEPYMPRGSIMRMTRSASDRNLSAGSTCKVAWKARTLSEQMHPLGGHTDVAVRGNHY